MLLFFMRNYVFIPFFRVKFNSLKGDNMLDFEKELEKFQPSLEIEDVADVIRHNDVSDVADLIKEVLRESGEMR